MQPTFFTQLKTGQATARDIDGFIARWRSGEAPPGMALHTFLGLSEAQYAAWLADPDTLAPPIGPVPHARWLVQRVQELEAAIGRFLAYYGTEAEVPEMIEWRVEMERHRRYLEARAAGLRALGEDPGSAAMPGG